MKSQQLSAAIVVGLDMLDMLDMVDTIDMLDMDLDLDPEPTRRGRIVSNRGRRTEPAVAHLRVGQCPAKLAIMQRISP